MAPQIILTTGGNQGLGLAIIQVVAQRAPATTHILACRDLTLGNAALQSLREQGIKSEIEVLQLDVTNDDQIANAIKYVDARYHRLDVLINNAGILRRPADDSLPTLRHAYNDMCSTNLTSVAVVTTAFLPLLHASDNPKVINITSGLGSLQNTLAKKMGRYPPYGASKIGMNGVTVHMQAQENDRVAAEKGKGEQGKEKIKFYVVAPGVLKTAFTNYLARGKEATEGAEAVVRLALDEKGAFEGGTHWEFEEGMMRTVPW